MIGFYVMIPLTINQDAAVVLGMILLNEAAVSRGDSKKRKSKNTICQVT